MADLYANLENIIENTVATPTIVNEKCNFVVITYWWGRGRNNANLARPCGIFYETFISKVLSKVLNVLSSSIGHPFYDTMLRDIHNCNFIQIIDDSCRGYFYDLMLYLDLNPKCFPEISVKNVAIKTKSEEFKKVGKVVPTFQFESSLYVHALLQFVAIELIKNNKELLDKLVKQIKEVNDLKNQYLNKELNIGNKKILKIVKNKTKEYESVKTEIKKQMNTKYSYVKPEITAEELESKGELFQEIMKIYEDPSITNKSLNEILIEKLRYKPAITYDEMIKGWEEQCAKVNVNYMAIEYNEFTKPGGYQLAINAKPMFIKKALKLCEPRNVLYIDGDMYVRKYPSIFDLKDIDYMARGWSIDPRSSYKFLETIMYDPYTFETSGGTMFFSQSSEADTLLNLWIQETKKPVNAGKADDRIISLLFNTKKLLCSMKIIQLPIEYLWLTLFYDDYVGGFLYDYDNTILQDSIFIDHPECLTSEDTAAGEGASSERTPIIYDKFIANISEPISEEFYEYIFFENEDLVKSMKYYLDYMKNAYYFYDGNDELVQKKFVHPGGLHEDNEQPLYIFNYNKKYGKHNDIHEENIKKMENINIEPFNRNEYCIVEIRNIDFEEELIPTVLKCMSLNLKCIYLSDNHNPSYYENFKQNYGTYKNLDFAYVTLADKTPDFKYNNFYKMGIDTKQPIFFNGSADSTLFKYISMFRNMDDFCEYLMNGSYFFMSRTRVGYLALKAIDTVQSQISPNAIPPVPHIPPIPPINDGMNLSEINNETQQQIAGAEEIEDNGYNQDNEDDDMEFNEDMMEYMSGLNEMYPNESTPIQESCQINQPVPASVEKVPLTTDTSMGGKKRRKTRRFVRKTMNKKTRRR